MQTGCAPVCDAGQRVDPREQRCHERSEHILRMKAACRSVLEHTLHIFELMPRPRGHRAAYLAEIMKVITHTADLYADTDLAVGVLVKVLCAVSHLYAAPLAAPPALGAYYNVTAADRDLACACQTIYNLLNV